MKNRGGKIVELCRIIVFHTKCFSYFLLYPGGKYTIFPNLEVEIIRNFLSNYKGPIFSDDNFFF